ncbi:MAG: hypothetical protein N2554_10575 [Fimbriimonadales bacterium]|nr:hypothetical protein [Fimbriimonadales bacterium]
MTKRHSIGIGFLAAAALVAAIALGASEPPAAKQDDQPPRLSLPPSPVKAKTLFTIPYGEAENEICDFSVGPGEGDSVTYTLADFRRLANGNFALLASRPGGGRLQVFNERGELVKSVPMYVHPEHGSYHIRSDGMVFWANPIMIEYAIGIGRQEAGMLDEETSETQRRSFSEPYQIPSEVAVRMPLLMVQASDAAQQSAAQAIQDQLRLQFVDAYREHRIEEILGSAGSIFAADDGSVYVGIGLPSPGEGRPAECGTLCFRVGQAAPQVFRPTGAEYLALPDNTVGTAVVVNIDGTFCTTERSKIRVRRLDGSIYAEFQLPRELQGLLAMPGMCKPLLLSPNRIVWRFSGLLVVLDRNGNILFHDDTNPKYCQQSFDVDSQGNLYYVTFTDKGLEVRVAAVGR